MSSESIPLNDDAVMEDVPPAAPSAPLPPVPVTDVVNEQASEKGDDTSVVQEIDEGDDEINDDDDDDDDDDVVEDGKDDENGNENGGDGDLKTNDSALEESDNKAKLTVIPAVEDENHIKDDNDNNDDNNHDNDDDNNDNDEDENHIKDDNDDDEDVNHIKDDNDNNDNDNNDNDNNVISDALDNEDATAEEVSGVSLVDTASVNAKESNGNNNNDNGIDNVNEMGVSTSDTHADADEELEKAIVIAQEYAATAADTSDQSLRSSTNSCISLQQTLQLKTLSITVPPFVRRYDDDDDHYRHFMDGFQLVSRKDNEEGGGEEREDKQENEEKNSIFITRKNEDDAFHGGIFSDLFQSAKLEAIHFHHGNEDDISMQLSTLSLDEAVTKLYTTTTGLVTILLTDIQMKDDINACMPKNSGRVDDSMEDIEIDGSNNDDVEKNLGREDEEIPPQYFNEAMLILPKVDYEINLGIKMKAKKKNTSKRIMSFGKSKESKDGKVNDEIPSLLLIHSVNESSILSKSCLQKNQTIFSINNANCLGSSEDEVNSLLRFKVDTCRCVSIRTLPAGAAMTLRRAVVGGVGGFMVGVGSVIFFTPLHPIGHAMAMGGMALLATEFERPKKMIVDMKNSMTKTFAKLKGSKSSSNVEEETEVEDKNEEKSLEEDKKKRGSNSWSWKGIGYGSGKSEKKNE